MKTTTPFPILRLRVDTAENPGFLQATQGRLPQGWSRHCDFPAFFAPQTFYARYLRDRRDGARTFHLYLLRTDPNTLSVVSILPSTGTLTIPEHCAILQDFRSSVLSLPSTRRLPSAIVEPLSPSPALTPPEPWASPPPEVVNVLERWTQVNHGAGFHPFDPFNWRDLIVALHLTKRLIDFQWLIDWFHLKHLLPEDALVRLQEDFFSSLTLLRCHDEYLDPRPLSRSPQTLN